MSGSTGGPDDGERRSRGRIAPTEPPGSPPDVAPPDRRLTIVEYDGRPDRATVCVAGGPGTERTGAWLSVDVSVVVDRSAWR